MFGGLVALLLALPTDRDKSVGDVAWPQLCELDLADRGNPVLLHMTPVIDNRAVAEAPDLFLHDEPSMEPFGNAHFVAARLDAFAVLTQHLSSGLSSILGGGEATPLDLAAIAVDGRQFHTELPSVADLARRWRASGLASLENALYGTPSLDVLSVHRMPSGKVILDCGVEPNAARRPMSDGVGDGQRLE